MAQTFKFQELPNTLQRKIIQDISNNNYKHLLHTSKRPLTYLSPTRTKTERERIGLRTYQLNQALVIK